MAYSLISSISLARVPATAGQTKTAGRSIAAPARAVLRLQAPRAAEAAHANKLVMRAIPVSGPSGDSCGGESGGSDGQVTGALMDAMRSKIGEALETDKVDITDVYGDGRHVSIDVVSDVFEGKSSMQRQRMVYKAIWMELQETVHAVDNMTTKTPAEISA